MTDPLKSLASALPARVAALETRARAMASLTEQVRQCVPPETGSHLLSASYKEGTLSVTMDSAAWCPQVRYGVDELRERLRSLGGPDFVKLRVRVGKPAV